MEGIILFLHETMIKKQILIEPVKQKKDLVTII